MFHFLGFSHENVSPVAIGVTKQCRQFSNINLTASLHCDNSWGRPYGKRKDKVSILYLECYATILAVNNDASCTVLSLDEL